MAQISWEQQAIKAHMRFEESLATHRAYLASMVVASELLERRDMRLAELLQLAIRIRHDVQAAEQRRLSRPVVATADIDGWRSKAATQSPEEKISGKQVFVESETRFSFASERRHSTDCEGKVSIDADRISSVDCLRRGSNDPERTDSWEGVRSVLRKGGLSRSPTPQKIAFDLEEEVEQRPTRLSLEQADAAMPKRLSIQQAVGALEMHLDGEEGSDDSDDTEFDGSSQPSSMVIPLPIKSMDKVADEEQYEARRSLVVTIATDDYYATPRDSEPPTPLSTTSEAFSGGSPRKVSWAAALSADTRLFHRSSFDGQLPAHGHWLPEELTRSRPSFQGEAAKPLGGRLITLNTGLNNLTADCVLIEPMGLFLAPGEYVHTGLVVCLGDLLPTKEVADEWSQILKRTKLLDAGMSIALLDIRQPKEEDESFHEFLEAAVVAAVKAARYDGCFLLCGKAWGAQCAVSLAVLSSEFPRRRACPEQAERQLGTGSIAGVVLLAPSVPPPERCERLEVPVLVIWARDDKVSCYKEGAELWADALEARRSSSGGGRPPTAWREAKSGAHDMGKVLKRDDRAACEFMYFTATCLLIEGLSHAAGDYDVDPESLPPRLPRLCDELPSTIATLIGTVATDDDVGGLARALCIACVEKGVPTAAMELSRVLMGWLRGGMQPIGAAAANRATE